MNIPEGLEGKALHKFLKENKALLIAAKKATIKHADAFTLHSNLFVGTDGVIKEFSGVLEDTGKLEATLIINTTNLMDSHSDVHIPGLWKKSLKETKDHLHLQEHQMAFDKVIADSTNGIKAFTKSYSWRELGMDANGMTEALVFVSTIDKNRNPFMYDQYRKGYVKNHSVGMRYVQLFLCINEPDDKWYAEEYENWEKYLDEAINKDEVEAQGYFWAVTEAKVVEGSAVVRGSNWITPTQSIQSKRTQEQPAETTVIEPPKSFDISKAINEAVFIP